jgi:hypothetical protein
MRKVLEKIGLIGLLSLLIHVLPVSGQTYCNPLILGQQFTVQFSNSESLSDPTVVLYKNSYYLFASNAHGYWSSGDLRSWTFISGSNLPLDKKEITATVIGDWLYFFASNSGTIYRTSNPESGRWDEYANSALLALIADFAVFADPDGRVYCYYGCSNHNGVMFRELDPKNQLNPVGSPIVCQLVKSVGTSPKKAQNATSTTINALGSWMCKYNGKYYYQRAELNKGFNNYSDMVYVSDNPAGPFTFAGINPIAYIPEGYISGAHKGSTFADKYGNWWYISTVSVKSGNSQLTKLALFPAGFDEDGNLFTKSDFGDYPIVIPKTKNDDFERLDPEWALISDESTVQASTSAYPEVSATDDDVSTFWSAKSGKKGEWLSLNLGSECTVNALQINFYRNKITPNVSDSVKAYQYLIEYSENGRIWKKLVDETRNTWFQTAVYHELQAPVQARYLKITSYNVPEGTFAVSDFRVFGLGSHRKPRKITEFKVIRDYRDVQSVKLFWKKQANTTGFNIRYGTEKDKLVHSYPVSNSTNKITIHCPDKSKAYWFRIDAFNTNGVAEGKPLMCR